LCTRCSCPLCSVPPSASRSAAVKAACLPVSPPLNLLCAPSRTPLTQPSCRNLRRSQRSLKQARSSRSRGSNARAVREGKGGCVWGRGTCDTSRMAVDVWRSPSALRLTLTRLWSAHAQRYDPSDIHEHDPHPTVAAHGVPALPLPPARSRTDHLSPGDAVGERESERAADRPSDQGLQHRRSVRALLPCRRVWRQGVSRDQGLRAGERGGRRSNASGDASHTAGFEGPCLNDWGT
jgi:hypothetical protein